MNEVRAPLFNEAVVSGKWLPFLLKSTCELYPFYDIVEKKGEKEEKKEKEFVLERDKNVWNVYLSALKYRRQ